MTGITPDIFTFMGRWVDWPPYILRPTIRLAYWMGMRRSAFVINTIKPIMATATTRITTREMIFILPLRIPLTMLITAEGPRETMEANRIREMPLPTPLELICSPSHIMKLEPAVKVRIITMALHKSVRVSTWLVRSRV